MALQNILLKSNFVYQNILKIGSVVPKIIVKSTSVAIILVALSANAVPPLTPRLTTKSHAALLAKLTSVNFPQVGQNSVVIALTGVLRFKSEQNSYDYENMTAPHLPRIKAVSVPDGSDCVRVRLRAVYQQPQSGEVSLNGRYCLVSAGEWQATKQSVVREK
jgi:hypothetical protein